MLFDFAAKRPPKIKAGRDLTAEEVTREVNLRGKTFLVTGANSGLGFETLRVLSMRGAHVIAACRTMEKAEETCDLIAGRTTPMACDLSSLHSVEQAVAAVVRRGAPLDAVICNAGVMGFPAVRRTNGLELQFLVNHLGHFALVNGLLPALREAEQGRIVVVASEAHRWAPRSGIRFDDLGFHRGYSGFRAYGHSKLANLLFTFELSRRLKGTRITANAVHPGIVQTGITRNGPEIIDRLSNRFGQYLMRPVARGAACQCYVATHPRLARVSGYYFSNCNPKRPSAAARDKDLAAQLWKRSDALITPPVSQAPPAPEGRGPVH